MFPLAKTLRSLHTSGLFPPLLLSAATALGLVLLLVVGLSWGAAQMLEFEQGWMATLVNLTVGVVGGVGGWFMLPVLVPLVAGLFQEGVLRRVEERDYPACAQRQTLPFWSEAGHALAFAGRAALLNLAVVPFYLVGIGFPLAVLVNGYLLGVECFEGVAAFHRGREQARRLRRRLRWTVLANGLLLALLTLVPLVNLGLPLVATVWMLHLYHAIGAGGEGAVRPRPAPADQPSSARKSSGKATVLR